MGALVPPHLADAITAANGRACNHLEAPLSAAARILTDARQRYGTLASLADGRPPDDVLRWGSEALAGILDDSDAGPRTERPNARRSPSLLKRVRRRARASLPAVVDIAHRDAATAFLSRLRRWGLPNYTDEELLDAAADSLAHLTATAQCHMLAVLKTWADAWPTSARRGLAVQRCPPCRARRADHLGHLIACPALREVTSRAFGIAAPVSLSEALTLTRTRRCGQTSEAWAPPEVATLFLSCLLDTYQSVAEVPGGRRGRGAGQRLLPASAAHAKRRLAHR